MQTQTPLTEIQPLAHRHPPARISRLHRGGMKMVAVESSPVSEFHLTVTPERGETAVALAHRLADALHFHEATVVRAMAFGALTEQPATVASLRQALEDPTLSVTWMEGMSCGNQALAGLQIQAIAGAKVQSREGPGRSSVRYWEDGRATHCVVGPLLPAGVASGGPEQAREVFEQLQSALASTGLGMADLARTWFFLDGILDWYPDFNQVRRDFFAQSEVRVGSVPASTGVSGRNIAGKALVAAAWAVRPQDQRARGFEPVASPRQCPAAAYGSAFSRAVEIKSAGYRQLVVSGTASIAPEGGTLHVGDVRGQIELSMEVVWAILDSRRMKFKDVTRAIAYFKSAGDAPVFHRWLEHHHLTEMPVVSVVSDICRDDLLFEIELDAVCEED